MSQGKTVLWALLVLATVAVAGCEPMVLDEGDAPDSVSVAGTWSYTDTGGGRSTWVLTQADDESVDGTGSASEEIAGYVSDDSVKLTVTYSSNLVATVSGTVSDGVMSGTFTNSASVRGAWVAYALDDVEP